MSVILSRYVSNIPSHVTTSKYICNCTVFTIAHWHNARPSMSVRSSRDLPDVQPGGGRCLPRNLVQELPKQVEAHGRMGQEQVVSRAGNRAEAHVRIELRQVPNVVERGHGVLLSMYEQGRNGRYRREDPVDLIVQQAMLER